MPCCPGSCRPSWCFLKIRKDPSIQKSLKNRSKKRFNSFTSVLPGSIPRKGFFNIPVWSSALTSWWSTMWKMAPELEKLMRRWERWKLIWFLGETFAHQCPKFPKASLVQQPGANLKKYQQNLHNPRKPKCPPCLLQTVHKAHVEVRQGNVVDVLAKWIFKLLRAAIWLTNPSQSNLISSYLISSHLSLSILTYVILSHLVLSIYRVRISISIFTCSFSTCNAPAQSPWQLHWGTINFQRGKNTWKAVTITECPQNDCNSLCVVKCKQNNL